MAWSAMAADGSGCTRRWRLLHDTMGERWTCGRTSRDLSEKTWKSHRVAWEAVVDETPWGRCHAVHNTTVYAHGRCDRKDDTSLDEMEIGSARALVCRRETYREIPFMHCQRMGRCPRRCDEKLHEYKSL